MTEERKLILEMLAERKITAEEAAELLRAIGAPAVGTSSPPPPEAAPRSGDAAATQAPGAFGATRVRVGATPGKSILEDFLGRLDIDLSNLPFAFSGEGYRFEEEYTGAFEPGSTVRLDFQARNGRVEIYGWDQPGWRVILRKKIRAQSEEAARERSASICRFAQGVDFLEFEELPTGWGISGVSAEVHVPRGHMYSALAASTNGRVVVEGINGTTVVGKTANGKVTVRRVNAHEATLSTANGGIVFSGSAQRIDCDTANGTISCCPVATADTECRLHTSNGSIKVKLPPGDALGYDIDAYTSHGTIDLDLGDFEIVSQEGQFGRKILKGRTKGFANRPVKTVLGMRTTNGSIRIVNGVPGDEF